MYILLAHWSNISPGCREFTHLYDALKWTKEGLANHYEIREGEGGTLLFTRPKGPWFETKWTQVGGSLRTSI